MPRDGCGDEATLHSSDTITFCASGSIRMSQIFFFPVGASDAFVCFPD